MVLLPMWLRNIYDKIMFFSSTGVFYLCFSDFSEDNNGLHAMKSYKLLFFVAETLS